MPRNASGVYSLPVAAYVANTTIRSADMNTNLSDIGTALTESLATTGVSSMTGPLKLAAGSAAAPSLTLASDTGTGFYNSAAGTWVWVTGATTIMTLSPTGVNVPNMTVGNLTVTGSFSVAANRLVGEIIDYGGSSAPALWLLCYGQAIDRTTYSSLFGIIGTTFGSGDGSTTFNVPDLRGRTTYGKDNMGGVAANRITAGTSGITGTTLGAAGGAQSISLAVTNLPSHGHQVTVAGGTSSSGDLVHGHDYLASSVTGTTVVTVSGATSVVTTINTAVVTGSGANTTSLAHSHSMNFTVSSANTGSGTAYGIVSPGLITNKIIYTGV